MSGDVLVQLEVTGGAVSRASRQAARAARELAAGTGGRRFAVVFGEEADVRAAAPYADEVLGVALEQDDQDRRVRAMQVAAERSGAPCVVLPSSRSAQAVAPRLAVRLGAALLEEVVELWRDGEALAAVRLTYLQRVRETVRSQAERVVITVRANAFEPAEPGEEGTVDSLDVAFGPEDDRVRVLERQDASGGRVPLEEAPVVVAGGRGVGDAEGFETLVVALADALNAGVGATRAVVDAGWRPFEEQIGQTGKTVSPALYLALGVSGAVQHLSGMNRSGVVVAINRDADAPIFRACDYGLVGDLRELVPALRAALAEEA